MELKWHEYIEIVESCKLGHQKGYLWKDVTKKVALKLHLPQDVLKESNMLNLQRKFEWDKASKRKKREGRDLNEVKKNEERL